MQLHVSLVYHSYAGNRSGGRTAWETAVTDAFRLFDIRSVVLLGGEATIDPAFWDKLAFLSDAMEGKRVDRLILTTNGIRLRDPAFRAKLAAPLSMRSTCPACTTTNGSTTKSSAIKH